MPIPRILQELLRNATRIQLVWLVRSENYVKKGYVGKNLLYILVKAVGESRVQCKNSTLRGVEV